MLQLSMPGGQKAFSHAYLYCRMAVYNSTGAHFLFLAGGYLSVSAQERRNLIVQQLGHNPLEALR